MDKAIIALVALTAMEIVLGIDNIVFISILTGRLPKAQRTLAFRLGLGLALIMRVLLLATLTWIMKLNQPVFTLEGFGINGDWFYRADPSDPLALAHWKEVWHHINEVSWRDLILLGGGLFLVAKSVYEINHLMDDSHGPKKQVEHAKLGNVLVQVAILDIVFSLDSVITAVGMVDEDQLWVMVTAVVLAIAIMVVFASKVGEFVNNHPSLKMLALSFLILIGVMLIAEGAGTHINKGYIYFSMAFALIVEILNMRARTARKKKEASAASYES
ncbi:MAG: TerC family protein [Planctomycetaceae bacterium]|nr:TerC family protein [Planctomycetaceae bacterium]